MIWDSMSVSCENCESPRMMKNEQCCDVSPMDGSFTEKENIPEGFGSPSPKFAGGELLLYESNSPSNMSFDESPAECSFTLRRPLDDLDHNSQDSGYSACESNKFSPKSRALSFGSMASIDEAFLDISELEPEDENVQLPGGFNKLITGSLAIREAKKSPDMVLARPPFRRALSMITNSNTPNSKARSCLFKTNQENEVRNFKRPEPPSELISPINVKRSKMFHEQQTIRRIPARSIFQRSISATEDSIKSALQRSSTEPDLIGDFSKAFCLPLIAGRHQDLKSITAATLAELICGEFADSVASYKVIDCRYPYEFEGGHIVGAQNIYTKQQVLDELLNAKIKNLQTEVECPKRNIVIFHCEFSSERGPNLSRYLRNIDRSQNKDFYPLLHYPEVYLLDGGYKGFFEKFSQLCTPNGYLPMLHPDHEHNLRHFRAKSKTWNADCKSKSNLRSSSYKRL